MLHIDLPSRSEIEGLATFRGSPAVSLYLPTTPLTQDAQADRIGLKNLLKTAVAEMEAADVPKRAVRAIEDATEARVAFVSRFGDGVLVTDRTVLQENDVLHVLMDDERAAVVERRLTHAPKVEAE